MRNYFVGMSLVVVSLAPALVYAQHAMPSASAPPKQAVRKMTAVKKSANP